jgi:DNA (cytosine-5)-methyltransferase 1
MLASLSDLGYAVEWRVVNAAEYGFPQRRKRVFIVAKIQKRFPIGRTWNAKDHLTKTGVLARALPVRPVALGDELSMFNLDGDLAHLTEHFDEGPKSPFKNSGTMIGRTVSTIDLTSAMTKSGKLGNVLLAESRVPAHFFVPEEQLESWRYLKGSKKEGRVHSASGFAYDYSEGSMAFPDLLTNPARTVLTGEGGSTPSRFKHIIQTKSGRYRRLTPVELERLNGFPDDWTRYSRDGAEISDSRRAFFMGNALVVGVVERIGCIMADDWHLKQSGP